MTHCKRCANYEKHESLERCARCYLDYVSSEHKITPIYFQPKTNADRIRVMSDEELAEWALHKAPDIGREYTHSLLGLIQWLKQPAEED